LDEDDLLSDGFATDSDYSPEDNESVNLNETELDSALFLAHKAYGSAYGSYLIYILNKLPYIIPNYSFPNGHTVYTK
jgi:hypothetical protein